ncbi:dihydrofolate reductase family protein [Bacillus ectoiniformans]|uniref:dihydrofolate reductase family protein n=1 Tax=Bacillus ectoiniformans TaxID=1494429 RepID=UPI0019584A5E|nr:dihydrofolate reductase family protein [Bacillus ectoiniformans]
MVEERKVVLFIAASLDGYIAKSDGDISWLNEVEGEGDNGFTDFYKTVDTIMMGKSTYDHVLELTGGNYPHADKETYVFTSKSGLSDPNIQFINEPVDHLVSRLKSQEGRDIWLVGGAKLLQSFMEENLVDEYIVTIAPVILGEGIPLFHPTNTEVKLELKSTKAFGQFIQHHYERIRT